MAWLAVDKNGDEGIYSEKPTRNVTYGDAWMLYDSADVYIALPSGSIEKLIGRSLSWNDEPVEIV